MPPSRMAEHLGRVLGGRYRVIAPIGAGASAQVFLADDVILRRRVAVKLLHPALADDEGFLRRFRAEAQAAAALSHPHVMAVYDWGDEEDGPYLVSEYLGGGSLRAMLDRGARLSPAQALVVGLDAARGLDYAHRRGFVHRDIKPANLLFDDEGHLRIADFGLARALAEAAWTEPQGAVVGTARYASPEQARGEPVDGRADVYALSLVLVEAVTGQVPFAADTTIATLMARVGTPVPVPPELGPLAPVLATAGRTDPADRPDAAELGRALMDVARQLDRPAPLPLAGAVADEAVTVVADPDPTLLPLGGVAADAGRRAGTADGHGDGGGGVVAATEDDLDPDGAHGDASPAAPRRRRLRWRLVALVATVAAAAAGGFVGWRAFQVATAPVPAVNGLPVAEAKARIAAAEAERGVDWEVDEQREYVDGTAPGIVLGQEPGEGESLQDGGTLRYIVSRGPPPRDVPHLEALSEEEARATLIEAELDVGDVRTVHHEQIEEGRVVTWLYDDIERPVRLPKGSRIDIVLSVGPEPRTVPGLAGVAAADAAARLEALGLVPEMVEEFSRTVDKGLVIRTEPGEGGTAERGQGIRVVVSKGRDLVTVPDLDGMTIDEAEAALARAGLERGDVFGRGDTVFDADPQFGTSVDRGSVVNLYVRR